MPRRRNRRIRGINKVDIRRDGLESGIAAVSEFNDLATLSVNVLFTLYDASAIIGGASGYIATGAVNELQPLYTGLT